MPQASERHRATIHRWFRKGVSDYGPTIFLMTRGWTERNGMWKKPTPSHNPSVYELVCLLFLRDEWDHDFERPLLDDHRDYM